MRQIIMAICFLCSVKYSFAQENADKIIGTWYSHVKGASVKIYKNDNKYFGKLEYLKQPNDGNGKPLLDTNNPDTFRKRLPLIGLVFLNNLTYNSHNKWKGKFYDYDGPNGGTYNCYLKFNEEGTLTLRGYIGYAWMGLGRTIVLTKIIKD